VAFESDSDWSDVRLHVVTGKGGTGKTTVAGALALALATGGKRVLLLEVEGRQGIAQLFDVPPLDYTEQRIASAPDGGEVFGNALDSEEALLEFLDMFYNLRRAGSALQKMGAIDFATTIAPGVRDVLLTGKTKEAVRRKVDDRYVYDAVVMDAPPTGRITRFLNVNSEIGDLAKTGPIRTQADAVMAVIASPATAVHLVTLLEEMPVQETSDALDELRAAGLPVGAIIINQVRTPLLSDADQDRALNHTLDSAQLAIDLDSVGIAADDELVTALLDEAAAHAERVALERRERQTIEVLGRPTYELAFRPDGIDPGALYDLAETLRAQGVA
jgi:anion-transporting  ArsA/GET3 family ATPase